MAINYSSSYFFILLFLLGVREKQINNINLSKRQSEADSSALYPWKKDMPFSWQLYQGIPDTLGFYSKFKAITRINLSTNAKEFDDSIVFSIYCKLIKKESWVKKKTSLLLRHERGHFDIGEIVARKTRKKLASHTSKNAEQTNLLLKNLNQEYFKDYNNLLNQQYDDATALGTNESQQKKWEIKIQEMLSELSDYESTRIVIKKEW